MRKKANNFGRFYVLAKKNPAVDKESMVLQFTDGRTTHLREMYQDEYNEMCDALEFGPNGVNKAARSETLRRGINTVDNWDGIDAFCMSPRIAGKKFRELSETELDSLVKKLESIIRKGGLKSMDPEKKVPEPIYVHIPYRPSKHLS